MQKTLQQKISEFLKSDEEDLQYWVGEWLRFRGNQHLEKYKFIVKEWLDPQNKERGVAWSVSLPYIAWGLERVWSLRWEVDHDREYGDRQIICVEDKPRNPEHGGEIMIRVWTEKDLGWQFQRGFEAQDEMLVAVGVSLKTPLIAIFSTQTVAQSSVLDALLDNFHDYRVRNSALSKRERHEAWEHDMHKFRRQYVHHSGLKR